MPDDSSHDAPDFRAVFGELTGLYLLLSADLRILAASKAYLRATRQTEQIVGRHLFDVFPDSPENGHSGVKALALSFERVLRHKTPDSMPLQRYDVSRPDGTFEERYWSPVNTPVFDDNGRVRWLLHRVFDVTPVASEGVKAPRVAELESELFHTTSRLSGAYEELQQSEARLRLALEVGGMAIWEFGIRDGGLTISPELNRLIGFEPGRATSVDEVRAGFLDKEPPVRAAATRAWLNGQRTFEHQFRYRRRDDHRVVWLHLRAEILTDPEGAPTHVLGILQDATERVTHEERQRTLINELNHRVKNNLALVQSLAVRTFRGGGCDEALDRFVERLIGLAATHELLTRSDWRSAELADVVTASLGGLSVAPERLSKDGPPVSLPPDLAVAMSLAMHELATNAIKYGALSNEAGQIHVSWTLGAPGRRLNMVWRESGGPPVRSPTRRGFGTQLLTRIFRSAGGSVQTTYEPAGLACTITVDVA